MPKIDWQSYWNKRADVGHVHDTEHWRKLYAAEINLIVKSLAIPAGPILEMGCGDGSLYSHLDFINATRNPYVGVDFSEILLNQFRQSHPEAQLEAADLKNYRPTSKLSLIFSNGVIQYLDTRELETHLRRYIPFLMEDGVYLGCNIPFRALRNFYYSREHRGGPSAPKIRVLMAKLNRLMRGEQLGYWHMPRDFLVEGTPNIRATIYGGLFHPYRFSIALSRVRQ